MFFLWSFYIRSFILGSNGYVHVLAVSSEYSPCNHLAIKTNFKNNNYIVLDCIYKDLQQPIFPFFFFYNQIYAWVLYLHHNSYIATLWSTMWISLLQYYNSFSRTNLIAVCIKFSNMQTYNHVIALHTQVNRVRIGCFVPMHMIPHSEDFLHILTQFILYYKST